MNTKPKCVNRGTITHIWTDLNTKIDLPKELQLQYTNNKEFVAFLALIYNAYPVYSKEINMQPDRPFTVSMLAVAESGKHTMNSILLYWHLDRYGIVTNDCKQYTCGSRGPFNLIRAAHKYSKFQEHKFAVFSTYTARNKSLFWGNAAYVIERTYVNTKGYFAYE